MSLLGLAPIVGGAFSAYGQHLANQSNERIARENRAFQERMSSTAYQRAVEDMSAAGINPMLAISRGGASSPSGSTAQMGNVLGSASGSAVQAVTLKKQLQLLEAQAYKTAQEGVEAKARAALYGVQSIVQGAGAADMFGGSENLPWKAQLTAQQLEYLKLQQRYLQKQILLAGFQMPAARIQGSSAAAMLRIGSQTAASLLNPLRLIRGAKGTIQLNPTTFIKVPGRQ